MPALHSWLPEVTGQSLEAGLISVLQNLAARAYMIHGPRGGRGACRRQGLGSVLQDV